MCTHKIFDCPEEGSRGPKRYMEIQFFLFTFKICFLSFFIVLDISELCFFCK